MAAESTLLHYWTLPLSGRAVRSSSRLSNRSDDAVTSRNNMT